MKRLNHLVRTCVLTTAGSLCTLPAPVVAQTTQMDLRSQAKGVDFSKAQITKPFKTGTTLPVSCSMGESFFKMDAPPGQNVFGCTAPNTWTVESGSGLPSLSGNADRLLGTNGSQASWVALGGDVSGSPQSLLVGGLQGRRVAGTTPTDGQVLRWNSTSLNWEPGTVAAASVSSGTANANTGGDLFGLTTNATVTRLQNKPVSAAAPSDGQVLTWNQVGGQWQPQAPTSSLGGAGSTAAPNTTGGLGVAYSSASTITIGAGCSLSAPCNLRFGVNVVAITNSATVTWQSGAGTAYVYVTSAGTLTVGSNLTLTCSTGCLVASGVSGFPVNTIPIYTWAAQLNGWDAAGGHDVRATLSTKILSAGTGLILLESGQQTTVGLDTTLVPTYWTGNGALVFGTLAAASCSPDLALSVAGAVVGDAVAPGWPASLPASVLGNMRVTGPNTVSVRLCNLGSGGVPVPNGSYRATIVRGL